MANINLALAKDAKNDDFYTQLTDISLEISNYVDKFKNKIVFCNCDDPFKSNFVKYFLMNFNRLKIKELIVAGYKTSWGNEDYSHHEANNSFALRVVNTTRYLTGTQTDLNSNDVEYFLKSECNNIMFPLVGNYVLDDEGNYVKKFIKEEYIDKESGKKKTKIICKNLYYDAGDFRSDMSISLLKECDIVVTNPPFSLFREFVSLLVEYKKQFIIIGNKNAITYKEFFPLLKNNQVWIGNNNVKGFKQPDGSIKKFGNIGWFTNIDYEKRHQILPLDLEYVYYGHEYMYPQYDNYDAININKVSEIPSDYKGVMGVPITFLDKYCPEQFEILGATESEGKGFSNGLFKDGEKITQPMVNGKRIYKRLFIRRK